MKNGDYITVKVALNSSEEYNLDQEVKCLSKNLMIGRWKIALL